MCARMHLRIHASTNVGAPGVAMVYTSHAYTRLDTRKGIYVTKIHTLKYNMPHMLPDEKICMCRASSDSNVQRTEML